MKFRQIRYFAAVVEEEGFIAAAKKLNLAQPALSRQIQELERIAGVKLLDRSRHGTKMTKAGERFYAHSRSILEQAEFALMEARGEQKGLVGEVQIALPITASSLIAPLLIERVRKEYPEIRVTIIDGLAHEGANHIESGRVDFGLAPDFEQAKNLVSSPIFHENLFLAGKTGSFIDAGPVDFGELANFPLVLANREVQLRRCIDRAAERGNLQLNVAYEQRSVTTILTLVRSGLAFTILNYPAMRDYLEFELIEARPIVNPNFTRLMSIAMPKTRPLSRAAEATLAVFKNLLNELVQDNTWSARAYEQLDLD